MKTSRTGTKAGQWARLWEDFEEVGIPSYSGQAADIAKRYGLSEGHEILQHLETLYGQNLSMDQIGAVGDLVIAAFKLGQKFDGRLS